MTSQMNQWIRDFFTKQTYIEERKTNMVRPKDGIVCNTGSSSSSPWKRNRGDIITADIIWVYWSENQQQLYQFSLSLSLSCHVEKKEGKSLLCYVGVFLLCQGLSSSKCNKYTQTSQFADGWRRDAVFFNSLFDTDLFFFSFC